MATRYNGSENLAYAPFYPAVLRCVRDGRMLILTLPTQRAKSR